MKEKQTTFNLFEESTEEMLTINDEFFEEFEIEKNEKTSLAQNDLQEVKSTLETLDETFMILDEVLGDDTLDKLDDIDIMDGSNQEKIVSIDMVNDLSIAKSADFGKVNIIAIGVGGCGCNTIDRMFEERIEGIKFVAMDTSDQTLNNTAADVKYLLGENFFNGNGSGCDLDKVIEMFAQERKTIESFLENIDMLFLTGGIGRGTGTIGLIEIGKIARSMGILTIGFATLPRDMEINHEIVNKYYPMFRDSVDSNVVVENQRMHEIAKDLPIGQALKFADRMLVDGIHGISGLITNPGKINLDYADIKTAFSNQGSCVMGIGTGTGKNGIVNAIEEAMHSELINFENIKSSRVIIFNITCSRNSVTIEEATKGTDLIYSYNTDDNIEHLLFGYSYDESMGDKVKVTFIATGTHPTKIKYINDNKPKQEVEQKKVKEISDSEINIFDSVDPFGNEDSSGDFFKPDFFSKK